MLHTYKRSNAYHSFTGLLQEAVFILVISKLKQSDHYTSYQFWKYPIKIIISASKRGCTSVPIKFGWNYLIKCFMRRSIWICQCIFAFSLLSPHWSRVAHFIWTNLYPLHSRIIRTKIGWNWHNSCGEEVKNVKVYRQTDGKTDIHTAVKSKSGKLPWPLA